MGLGMASKLHTKLNVQSFKLLLLQGYCRLPVVCVMALRQEGACTLSVQAVECIARARPMPLAVGELSVDDVATTATGCVVVMLCR